MEYVIPGVSEDAACISRTTADHGQLMQCSVAGCSASCPSELFLEMVCIACSPFSAPTNNGYIYNGKGLYLLA